MTYVTSQGLRLWTSRSGSADDPAILLVMGAAAQAVHWPARFVRRLVEAGFQVIQYDHRDVGQSDLVDFDASPYTMFDMVTDAVAVLDGLSVETAHIVGTSGGGVMAQWLAAAMPNRVRTLTLMNTTPLDGDPASLPPPDPAFLAGAEALDDLPRTTAAQRIDVEIRFYSLFTNSPHFDRPAARHMAKQAVERAQDWTHAANHYRAGDGPEKPPSLSAIKSPTLVLSADSDPIFPPPHAAALASAIPNARLQPVPGLGHMMLAVNQPDHVADLILTHLTANSSVRGLS
ncbi:alpha/beta fold hydrolase [Actinoplanes sp. NPDC049265]|uniref:alpha/beta fold hydrolase n=1 Tax=Actinoplanes sp. NPDC049265 TaxID=3363902 RepID=UPI00370F7683